MVNRMAGMQKQEQLKTLYRPALLRILELDRQRLTQNEIAKHLNEEGFRMDRGQKWYQMAVSRWLKIALDMQAKGEFSTTAEGARIASEANEQLKAYRRTIAELTRDERIIAEVLRDEKGLYQPRQPTFDVEENVDPTPAPTTEGRVAEWRFWMNRHLPV